MEKPIIIWVKDDGKITKDVLEKAVREAYKQGYEDGKRDSNWWTVNYPSITTVRPIGTCGPTDITVSYTSSDGVSGVCYNPNQTYLE